MTVNVAHAVRVIPGQHSLDGLRERNLGFPAKARMSERWIRNDSRHVVVTNRHDLDVRIGRQSQMSAHRVVDIADRRPLRHQEPDLCRLCCIGPGAWNG